MSKDITTEQSKTSKCSQIDPGFMVDPKTMRPTNDTVNHPSHYTQGGIECLDAIEAAVTGLDGMDAVLTAQVIKYIWRWKKKNGLEDLEKARFYLNRLIKKLEVPNGA